MFFFTIFVRFFFIFCDNILDNSSQEYFGYPKFLKKIVSKKGMKRSF